MNFKEKVMKIVSKSNTNIVVNRKSLSKTYVSLFLAFVVLITATLSWFTVIDTAEISKDFQMEAVSGLRVNEGESLSNHIVIKDFKLTEVSSVDGRNIFFPDSGNYSSNTTDMSFREGTAGDRNNGYVHKDFTLQGGDSGVTRIYVKSYKITVGDQTFDGSTKIIYDDEGKPTQQVKNEECPIRIAFITDSGETPTLIDPTALVESHSKKYNAVNLTNATGAPSLKESSATVFSQYLYASGAPIFTLWGTEPVDVTMVVWLEGTSDKCKEYAGQSISVDIELESNWSDRDIITFIDGTLGDDGSTANGGWINKNNDCIVTMCYKDEGSYYTVVMTPVEGSSTQWYAPIPSHVLTDISFYRYSLTDEIIYNAWYTKAGVMDEVNPEIITDAGWIPTYGNLQETRDIGLLTTGTATEEGYKIYTAVRGNKYGDVADTDAELEKKRLSPCLGYWNYQGDGGSGGGSGGDEGGGSTGDTVSVSVYLEIPDSGEGSWMRSDLASSGNYTMYAMFHTGEEIEMSYDNGKCIVEGAKVTYGAQLRSFKLYNRNDGTNKDLIYVDNPATITSTINVSYKVVSDTQANKL